MIKNFKISRTEFEFIENAVKAVWDKKLEFIFKDKSRIDNTLIITYDSENLYYSNCHNGKLQFEKKGHNINIDQDYYRGWSVGLRIKDLINFLPKEYQSNNRSKYPKISGSPIKPLLEIHKSYTDNPTVDPYITENSYLATIVHELGHVYYNSYPENSWYFSDKIYNKKILNIALSLYDKEIFNEKANLYLPSYQDSTEVFAYCTEYSASNKFWSDHKTNLDKFSISRINEMLKAEDRLDYSNSDSTLSNAHDMSRVFGKLLIERHGNKWVDYLLDGCRFF